MRTKIPFDVEKWKSGKYDVVTRDGLKVLSLFVHDVTCNYPISVIHFNKWHGNHMRDGKFQKDALESSHDLFLTTKKRKVWIAIRKAKLGTDSFHITSYGYEDKSCISNECKDWHTIEVELPE